MIGAIIMIFVALWIYQSAMRAKVTNVMMWVAGAAFIFWVAQFMLIEINVSVFDLDGTKTESTKMLNSEDETCVNIKSDTSTTEKKDGDMGLFKNSSCSEVHGQDRQNKARFEGFSGILRSLYYELFPSIISFLMIAFLRVKFITKEKFAVSTLFGGILEVFQGIKHSFKTPE